MRCLPLIAALWFAPWPWGSVELPWLALWVAWLAIAVAIAPLSREGGGAPWPVVALALLFAALVGGQWLGAPGRIDPAALGLPWLAFLAFLAGALYGQSRRSANTLLRAAALGAAACALYALYADDAWRLASGAAQANLHAPLINRNHAATFYGCAAAVAFALLLARIDDGVRDAGRDPEAALRLPSGKALLAVVCFLLCLTAVFLTQSRAGIFATLLSLFLVGALALLRRARGGVKMAAAVGVAAVVALLVAELAGGRLALRLGGEGLIEASRAAVYRATWAMVADHPWTGVGFGRYAQNFPAYRPPDLNTFEVWDYAHNSWLELAAEVGVPFVAALAACGAWLLIVLLRRVLARRRSLEPAPLAAVGVLALGGVHALFDFSLQIPAPLMLFAAVAGVGWARSGAKRESQSSGL